MVSVNRRVGAGFSVLVLLFLAVVTVQLVVGDRMQAEQARRRDRTDQVRDANLAVLQNMTDAETGVRGFQLVGERIFLEPYDSGRVGALTALGQADNANRDPAVARLLTVERQAAAHWLDVYAAPIVRAGVTEADQVPAARGKAMFDRFRTANNDVGDAVAAERAALATTESRRARATWLLLAGLSVVFVVVALLLFAAGRRQVLVPLEHIRLTLQRLAAGDRSARALPAGPGELRAVAGTLNHLAALTERLLDAEQARNRRQELRQAVAAELQGSLDADVTAERIARLIGTTLAADAVHARIAVEPGRTVVVGWPPGAPSLSARTVRDILTGKPGTALTVPHIAGAVAIPLGGDVDCPPGLICLVRHGDPVWRLDERLLLASLGREIDHAARRQRLQHRQARLISELRVLDERKDAFVATVTHELRTPLTSILGYAEMLADGDGGELSALQQRGVSAILRNARRLQDTIGDLLLLDRANGRAVAPYGPVDLAALAAEAVAVLASAARARDIAVTVSGAGPAWVCGDSGQLERALHNVLDNALKFTNAGGRIDLRLGVEADRALVAVTDTGIGIPADDLPGLGTPFHRAANARHQAVQGSGLGLAIVQHIVGEHGGTIVADSRLGEGSTFTLALPSAPAPAQAPAAR
ncbi:MAG TPA: ATP-binding protein [Actinoplanes sp.]|nr:ATP-binding protein [Actinoplanes sp.]